LALRARTALVNPCHCREGRTDAQSPQATDHAMKAANAIAIIRVRPTT
jgi:hypothetical protein